jgi:D-alanyl-lipoteichoic acid acyltransferase DltB (MBOAT superfamily)
MDIIRDILLYNPDKPLIFSQYLFLFLFTIGYGFFALIHKNIKWRNLYLLAFSLFFYYKTGGLYFWILVFSTLVDYGCGNAIFKSSRSWEKRLYLILSLISNLGMLAFFKYSYYVTDVVNGWFGTDLRALNFLAVFSNQTFGTGFDVYEIVLPVGISFYTFQTLSYTIDIFRGNLKPTRSLTDFGFFVTFFPQLVAGPIVRAADFIPQIYQPTKLNRTRIGAAIFLILTGLFKKMAISDYISVNFVDRVFDNPELYSGFMNLMAVYGYSIQIYCDFSGYSDMAIGLAALMGFTLPINFNSPYKALSITDFWRRWHISLSSWLRDYLYISLGGNRKGKGRTYLNLMITMLLGGLWHGAATKFIIWGGLHGIALAVHKVWSQYVPLSKNATKGYKIGMGIFTFHFVALCWIYFRASDVATVNEMVYRIFNEFDWAGIGLRIASYYKVFTLIVFGFIIHFLPAEWKNSAREWFTRQSIVVQAVICALVIFIAYQAASAGLQPFIYFQF